MGLSGYHILGGVIPPYQVVQQQNAGLPPGGVPPWYAMQYPAGFVPPLLVSVDNPLEEDPFASFDRPPARGEREEAGLLRSHLIGEEYYVSENIDDVARLANVQVTGQIVGGVDFAQLLKGPIYQLKIVSVAQAREMLAGGQEAIKRAKEIAKGTWTKPALPGETSRENVYWKLDWHAKHLAEMKQTSANAVYSHDDDLKKWVLAAYSEWNAAEDGRGESERVAAQRLDDLGRRIAELPGVAVEAVRQLPGKIVESATGIPLWAWSLFLLGGVGLTGYGVWRILVATAPVAAPALIGAATRRYL